MFCITINADGVEAFREPKPRRWVPRNGFEKRADGNYYKVLKDPRCISDEEARQEILEKQRLKEEEEKRKQFNASLRPLLPGPACTNEKKLILLAKPNHKINVHDFLRSIKYKEFAYLGSDITTAIRQYKRARILLYTEVPEIDQLHQIAKMEVWVQKNIVKIWTDTQDGDPKYVLVNALGE